MDFDKRIKDTSKIFSLLNMEDAKEFVGKPGFFANSLVLFKDVKLMSYGLLLGIRDNGFELYHEYSDNEVFEYFIPFNFVDYKVPEEETLRDSLDSINERLRDIEADFPDICEAVSELNDSVKEIFERLRVLENIYRTK